MVITMYRDTAAGYELCRELNEEEIYRYDNAIEIEVPDSLLQGYYTTQVKITNKEYENMDFDEWIHWYYDHDEMEGLLNYIKKQTGNLNCVKVTHDYFE